MGVHFNEYLQRRVDDGRDPEYIPFDGMKDYLEHVDGKPRAAGVEAFLKSRGIELDFGALDDPKTADTVCGVGNLKNDLFLDLLGPMAESGDLVYEGSLALTKELKSADLKVGLATSSRNADARSGPSLLRRVRTFSSCFDPVSHRALVVPRGGVSLGTNYGSRIGCGRSM